MANTIKGLAVNVLSNLKAGLLFVAVLCWRWTPLATIAGFILALGVSAMYAGQHIVAAVLYFVGISLLSSKLLAEAKSHERKAGVFFVIVFLSAGVFAGSLWLIKHTYESQGHQASVLSTFATTSWQYVVLIWQWPWRWILSSLVTGLILMATVTAMRQRGPTASSSGLQLRGTGTVTPPCPYEWVHTIAETNHSQIHNLVRIAGLYYEPFFERAYIDFTVSVFNGSLYDVVISNVIKSGPIRYRFEEEWEWEKFHYKPHVESVAPILCRARSGCFLVIRQAIRREEVDRFKKKDCTFEFALLEITFEGLKESGIETTKLNFSQLYLESKKRALRHLDSLELIFMYSEEQWAALLNQNEINQLKERAKVLEDAVKTRKLIFQIDEERSQVHVERAGEHNRRVVAKVRLRCERAISEPVAVKAFHAALYEETENGDVPVIEQEAVQVVWAEPDMAVVNMEDGWTINEPLSRYRWFSFYFDVTDKLETKLSRKHFIRVTMIAVAQGPRSIDFYVDSWNYSNSTITVR